MAEEEEEELDKVCHYTTISGFCGILDAGQLWASNVSYLNDKEELLHGIKCASSAIRILSADPKLGKWRSAVTSVVQEMADGELPNTYATCFCERSDILSQWRGYGGQEQGICIAFSTSGLRDLNPKANSRLTPVIYGRPKGTAAVVAALQERFGETTPELFTMLGTDGRIDEVREVLSQLLPQIKHNSFAAELEWRLIIQHQTVRRTVCFRPARNIILPYLKVGNGTLPIKFVRIGPGHDTDLTRQSVEYFLKAKGYSVPVYASRVPFRT